MKSAEARDTGHASGAALAHLTRLVRGAHLAVSRTTREVVMTLAGPGATPVYVASETLTKGVYAVTGFGLRAGAQLAGAFAADRMRATDADRVSVHDASAAPKVLAVSQALWGDSLGRTPTLSPTMHVRRAGRSVPLTADGVRTAYGPVTGALAVFVHGWGETEAWWRYAASKRVPYADRLAADLGLTPVVVRYNTGLRVSDNAQALGTLLAEVVANWPVPVERIVLIGHSMGGLVIHGTLADAEDGWPALVSDTVTLGTPHHGAPLARGVHRLGAALETSERGRWLADVVRTRSGGVRDLEYGNIVAADWSGLAADGLDHRSHPAARAGVRHHAVVAVAPGFRGSTAANVGDLMVPVASAAHAETSAVTSRFAPEQVVVVRGATHLGLVNDDRVYAALLDWLS